MHLEELAPSAATLRAIATAIIILAAGGLASQWAYRLAATALAKTHLDAVEALAPALAGEHGRCMSVEERVAAERLVLAANEAFYEAFRAGDYQAMCRVWAERAPVACAHPGMEALSGRASVLESWSQLLRQTSPLRMRCQGASAHLFGDFAFVTCYEANGDEPAHLCATNVFVREDGQWKMVHHHAGPLSAPRPERWAPARSRLMN
ncbi:nuclear transport factor 2 family protein [Sorangium sp. So ce448]|uniref:nuclear transport factor 2 family protein n=1 Tax=Sorangium sp. So ce448 TaxID=3133314 RepID=UPI003F5EA936